MRVRRNLCGKFGGNGPVEMYKHDSFLQLIMKLNAPIIHAVHILKSQRSTKESTVIFTYGPVEMYKSD